MVDVKLTQPTVLEPPFEDPVLDDEGRLTDRWVDFYTRLSGRVLTGNVAGVRAGSITADGSGNVEVTFNPSFRNAVALISTTNPSGVGFVGISLFWSGPTGFAGTLVDVTSTPLPNYVANYAAIGF